jgi:hypothetical protein
VGFSLNYCKAENRDNFDDISKHEVEKAVRMLMGRETSADVRKKIAELQKSVAASVAEGGSSYRHLHSFLDEVTNL